MDQDSIDRAVAAVTGETLSEVRRLGFSLAGPLRVEFDPEPHLRRPRTIDGRRGLAADSWRSQPTA